MPHHNHRQETGPRIEPGTFGLADECSTTELTLLQMLGADSPNVSGPMRPPSVFISSPGGGGWDQVATYRSRLIDNKTWCPPPSNHHTTWRLHPLAFPLFSPSTSPLAGLHDTCFLHSLSPRSRVFSRGARSSRYPTCSIDRSW